MNMENMTNGGKYNYFPPLYTVKYYHDFNGKKTVKMLQ